MREHVLFFVMPGSIFIAFGSQLENFLNKVGHFQIRGRSSMENEIEISQSINKDDRVWPWTMTKLPTEKCHI